MKLVTFENVVYTDEQGYMQESEAKAAGLSAKKLSGTEFRRLMRVCTHPPPSLTLSALIPPMQVCTLASGNEYEFYSLNARLPHLQAGEAVPEWFAFKCVIDILQGKTPGIDAMK
eukprot:COSAG05_NODE_5433_length_1176_cov_1.433612_2_plen_115_part_00